MTENSKDLNLADTADLITSKEVRERLELEEQDAWRVLRAFRDLQILDLGPTLREPGKTGRGTQSYRIPKDAAERITKVLERMAG